MRSSFSSPNFARQRKKQRRILPRECHTYAREIFILDAFFLCIGIFLVFWREIIRAVCMIGRSASFFFHIFKNLFEIIVCVPIRVAWFLRRTIVNFVIGIAHGVFFVLRLFGNSVVCCVRFLIFFIFSFSLPERWHVKLIGFSTVSIVLALPFSMSSSLNALNDVKIQTQERAADALANLRAGGEAAKDFQFKDAQYIFREAFDGFQDAQKTLDSVNTHVRDGMRLIPYTGKKLVDAEQFLEAGKELARAGEMLSQEGPLVLGTNFFGDTQITSLIEKISYNILQALADLESANRRIWTIDEKNLPTDQQEAFLRGREALRSSVAALTDTHRALTALNEILGARRTKRYLILFQNNTELRATGGFIGSFARIDVDRGRIEKIEIPGGGPYDLKGSLRARVLSPGPLHLLNPRWQLQDANWFPDFPTSAQKVMWFYEQSGQSSVDGVIAVNASVFEDLLPIIGPIEMPAYGKTISALNFFKETQKAVEFEYDKRENKPKKFISDLFMKTIERFQSSDQEMAIRIADLLLEALRKRDVQLYFKNQDAQSFTSSFGLSGEILPSDADYLMIVDSNVGGDKTDRSIEASVDHTITIHGDGSLEIQLDLTRTHHGKAGELFTGTRNVNFVRFYVPEGSVFLSSSGFQSPHQKFFKNAPDGYEEDGKLRDIQGVSMLDESSGIATNREFGKTVFSGWIQTDVQSRSHATLRYKLPFTINDLRKVSASQRSPYTLRIQRQSSSTIKEYRFSVRMPSSQSFLWAHTPSFFSQSNIFSWKTANMQHDAIFAFLFQ